MDQRFFSLNKIIIFLQNICLAYGIYVKSDYSSIWIGRQIGQFFKPIFERINTHISHTKALNGSLCTHARAHFGLNENIIMITNDGLCLLKGINNFGLAALLSFSHSNSDLIMTHYFELYAVCYSISKLILKSCRHMTMSYIPYNQNKLRLEWWNGANIQNCIAIVYIRRHNEFMLVFVGNNSNLNEKHKRSFRWLQWPKMRYTHIRQFDVR